MQTSRNIPIKSRKKKSMERDPEMTYDRLSNKNVKTAIINTPHSRASTEKQEHNMERHR